MKREKIGTWTGPWSGREFDVFLRHDWNGWHWCIKNDEYIESTGRGWTKKESLANLNKMRPGVKYL